jgi:DNA-binding transcriptional MerR regulator/predicted RNase H-like HicB family nuclease
MESTGYNADAVRRLTGITYRQLDYWDRTGLVRPSIRSAQGKGSRRVYSFQDLVEVGVVGKMLASGVKLPTVRKAVRFLIEHFPRVRPLAQLTLTGQGKSVLVRMEDRLIDAAANGQVVISVAVGAIAAELQDTVVKMSASRETTFNLRGRSYRAVLTPDLEAGGFTIEVPELPGVITEADTISQARRMAREAAAVWLDAMEGTPAKARAAR